ncbi:MAG: hypothetical protein M1818_003185 [Claussenomyces sp. TS43310]|nr:MAG: hypothetical protein M1818_003185 [Claussenomyces sp. TS43310]
MTVANVEQQSKPTDSVPVLLLKTRSAPNDGYQDYFEASHQQLVYKPVFVPVLEHKLQEENLESFKQLLYRKLAPRNGSGSSFGGLIFTSQRAVEAFARVVEEGKLRILFPTQSLRVTIKVGNREEPNSDSRSQSSWPYLSGVPIYTVGPATTQALRAVSSNPPLQIFGEETGNGEALAHYISGHYAQWYMADSRLRPLLFLVGEQRRDIIPKTLMDPSQPGRRKIYVDELVVYGTDVMNSFPQDFAEALEDTKEHAMRWIVVFSPTGCKVMLKALDLLDEATGRVKTGERGGGCGVRRGRRQTYIITIGPTTREYLRKTFGFEPDACAPTPSPEGVGDAIAKFMSDRNVS